MTIQPFRTTALVLAAAIATACGSQSSNTDQRLAELKKKLADTQQQLAEATEQAPPEQAPASVEQAAPATPAPAAAPAPLQKPTRAAARQAATAKPANTTPPRPTTPPESQKYMAAAAADQAAKDAETQRLLDEQRAVNAKQAETNAQLQQQVEQLKPKDVTLPSGAIIPVRTTAELSTAKLSNGSTFEALLERDLESGDTVLAKAGTRVTGYVVSSDPGGRIKGTASLTVGVRSVVGVKGNVIALTTDSYTADAQSTKKRDATRTGIATGVGAIIGGIAGGGSGAAIGAGAGAAAGVGANAATRGEAAVIPAEELIEFRLTSPVTVVMQP